MTVKDFEETIASLSKQVTITNEANVFLSKQVASIQASNDEVKAMLVKLLAKETSPPHPPPPPNRYARLEFPKFDGEEPASWIFQAEQYFALNSTHADQQVTMASLHLCGDAVVWYRWLVQSIDEMSWRQFSKFLCQRFGSREVLDPMSSLAKLSQIDTVSSYITKFETLINLVPNLENSIQISLFLSGLRADIQAGFRLLRPGTLSHAFELAKNQEDAINATHKFNATYALQPTSFQTTVTRPLPNKEEICD